MCITNLWQNVIHNYQNWNSVSKLIILFVNHSPTVSKQCVCVSCAFANYTRDGQPRARYVSDAIPSGANPKWLPSRAYSPHLNIPGPSTVRDKHFFLQLLSGKTLNWCLPTCKSFKNLCLSSRKAVILETLSNVFMKIIFCRS